MLSHKNLIIIASAGSGKTTRIIEQTLALKNKRILVTTYTEENFAQINEYYRRKNVVIPPNIKTQTWYSFLLQDGVRPYQNHITERERINGIIFDNIPKELWYVPKNKIDSYFITKGNNIYRDRVSDFVCLCNKQSSGSIVKRLEKIYDYIFIDEIQDFSGYDLDFLECLFNSSISIVCVGDPRQATYSTNNSNKNKKYKKASIFDLFKQKEKENVLTIEENNHCYRCNQIICDFADALYPHLPKAISKNTILTGHDGIFYIGINDISEYINTHKPMVLRWSKRSDTQGLEAINIGHSKGRTYDRVLIFPTKPITEYIKTKDITKAGDLSKFYVAITRARYSVTFVIDV